MTALDLLRDLGSSGIALLADGPELVVRGPEDVLTDDLVSRLQTMKAEIIAALAEQAEADLLDAYEERAAILEFDEGLDREAAEALAWKQVLGEASDRGAGAGSRDSILLGP